MSLGDLLHALVYLELIFMLFLLNNLLSCGKNFVKRQKYSNYIFAETWLLNGGLYQMMIRFFCLFVSWFSSVYLIW